MSAAFRKLPNLLTASRIVLAPVIVILIARSDYRAAVGVFFLAGVSDALDGYVARRLHVESQSGAYLDPIADKLMLTSIYLSLGLAAAIPWWMVWTVLGRDILILSMVAAGLVFTKVRSFPPTVWGKLSTLLQICAAGAVLLGRAGVPFPVTAFLWAMLAATVWSGVHYCYRGLRVLLGGFA